MLLRLLLRLAGNPEWTENWKSWPHCNGQAGCWMHYEYPDAWCRCGCRWCKMAQFVNPFYHGRH